ncbi:hypothetical protein GGS24DRAFT_451176 [Hypoxylon argillaceum]|nr:hypothetical protein GGS24DRAFT_451176 [Hypoxylon argillaceum]
MQTLWSRAAQVQSSCRCRICLHSTNAFIRRSASAAPKRKVAVADVFTACYTTILGTAAVLDARRKNERRRVLDEELDRIRASSRRLDIQGSLRALGSEDGALDGGDSAPRKQPMYMTNWAGNERVSPLMDELKSIYSMAYQSIPPPSWLHDQVDWAEVEAAIVLEERDPTIELQEPGNHQQLAGMTATVVHLIDELVEHTQKYPGQRPEDTASIPDNAGDAILKDVENLRHGQEYPSYLFPTSDINYSSRVRTLLHEAIRRVFNQPVSSRETVGRICCNLFTAGVPPTIHTYNTLFAGFHRIRRPDLAQVVIDSYLDQTRWSATDQTIVCLLNHYRGSGGREGMREIVQRMRGVKEQGLDLSAFSGYAITKKRTDTTFDHLIRGWLYHEDVGIACMTFVASIRLGSSIPISTLQELFRGLLATANFSSARKLLIGIAKSFKFFAIYLSVTIDDNTTAVARELLRSLDQIIDISWLPYGEIFGQSYQNYAAVVAPIKLLISRLDMRLEAREMSQPPPLELNQTSAVPEGPYTRIARLISLERRCNDLEERSRNLIAALQAHIIHVKTGYDIDPTSILLSEQVTSWDFQAQRLALHTALSHIDVYDDLKREDITSQLLRGVPDPALVRYLEQAGSWKLDRRALVSFFTPDVASSSVDEEQALSRLYKQLEQRAQAVENVIRALLFTHLTFLKQRQAIHYYRNYYKIPFKSLVGYVYRTYNEHWLGVQSRIGLPYNDYTTYKAPPSLESPTPVRTDNSRLDTAKDFLQAWGKAAKRKKDGTDNLRLDSTKDFIQAWGKAAER